MTMRASVRRVACHEITDVVVARPYRLYNRLLLRDPATGRSIWTVLACDRRDDGWQVNGLIQAAYAERGRYDELTEPKYTDPGAIFDIMAVTVIHQNLQASAMPPS